MSAVSSTLVHAESGITAVLPPEVQGQHMVASDAPVSLEGAKGPQTGPAGGAEASSRRCPACKQELPAGVDSCPACGHHLSPPVAPADARSTREGTGPAAASQQEPVDSASAPGASIGQELPPPVPVATGEQPQETPAHAVAVAVADQQGSPPQEQGAQELKEAVQEEEEKEEEEGPIATFRKRRIAFKTLSRPLQVLLIATLTQIGVVALLLATQNLPQPQVNGGVIAEGQELVVSLAAFIVLAVSVAVGYWFALAGALRVHWSVRVLVFALVTWMLASLPISELKLIVGFKEEPYPTVVWLRWAQLALLALLWVWAAGISLVRWRAKRRSAASLTDPQPWHGRTFVGVLLFLLFYGGLEFGVWVAFLHAGNPAFGAFLVRADIQSFSVFLLSNLALLFYWSSTDLLEWGELLAKSLVASLRRVRAPWPLLILTPLAAAAMIVNVLRLEGSHIIPGLVMVAVLVVIVAFLARFAQIRADWPAQVPAMGILLGAVFLFVSLDLNVQVTSDIAYAQRLVADVDLPLFWLVSVPVALAALTVGLVLVARGRLGKLKQGAVGLFLVVVVLLVFIPDLPYTLSAAGVSETFLQPPFHLLGAIVLVAAVGTLVWIVWFLTQRRPLAEATKFLTIAFLLLAGLQTVDWISDFGTEITVLGALSTLLLAALFVLLVLWDFITSGEQVTNSDSPAFPREGRILLYMGYTLVATSSLLYAASLRFQGSGAGAPAYLTDDTRTTLGQFLLGPALVVLTFILSVGRRVQRRAAVAKASPQARQGVQRATQLGILGSGALVIALVVVFLVVSAFPRLVHLSARLQGKAIYTAAAPGPGCDAGGAVWAVESVGDTTTRCLKTGAQFTQAPGFFIGRVTFEFAGSQLPPNYRVSVQVDLSGWQSGCVGIRTHNDADTYYSGYVCTHDHSWVLDSFGKSEGVLANGSLLPTTAYTIEATTNGPNQQLALNGVEVASVSAPTITSGDIAFYLLNDGTDKESAVFRNFVFTPLPASTPVSSQTAYQAPRPGPGCDTGKAQWVLMTQTTAAVHCHAAGMQLETLPPGSGKDSFNPPNSGVVAFLPPSATFPENYRAAVHVDLSMMPKGCAGIELRASAEGGYLYTICRDGSWAIYSHRPDSLTTLAGQQVTPASTYTIEATVQGTHLHLAIDGVELASVSDDYWDKTTYLSLGLYNDDGGVSAVFSDFIFTPLP